MFCLESKSGNLHNIRRRAMLIFSWIVMTLPIFFLTAKSASAAVEFISGFEVGDSKEFDSTSGTQSIQTTTLRAGAYAFRSNPTTTAAGYILKSTAFTDPSYTRFYFRVDTAPSLNQEVLFCAHSTTTCDISNHGVALFLDSARQINVYRMSTADGGVAQCAGTTVLTLGQWYLIELFLNRVGTDSYELKINGQVECSGNLDTALGAALDNWFWGKTVNIASQTVDFYYDDIQISADGYPGKGQIIARQFIAGTPTYDNFGTKSGCATAADCWSDTPANTATYAATTVDAKQTALVASFTEKITGYGRDIIRNNNLINTCTVKAYTNSDTTGNHTIIKILSGAETATSVQVTNTVQMLDMGYWTPGSLNALNTMEAGMEHVANNVLLTYDMWVMCDYIPRRIIIIQ